MQSRPWLAVSVIALLLSTIAAIAGVDGHLFTYTLPLVCLIGAVAALILPDSVWRWTGLGLAGWIVGDMLFFNLFAGTFAVPSWPDLGYVLLYVGMFVSLYCWAKTRYRFTWRLALDGALVGVTAGALIAAFALPKLIEGAQTASLASSFSLVYPVADMMLLMFVILVLGRRGWQPERTLILVGCALVCFTITDVFTAVFTLQDAVNGDVSIPSSALDLGRMTGALLLAVAASMPPSEIVYNPPSRWARIGIPSVCAVLCLALLALGRLITIPLSSWTLATVASVLVVGRLVTAYIERDEAYEERARQESLLRDLLADMSHELRTPLTNVRGQLEQLYSERGTDSRQLSSALRSSQRMETLIGELLLLARAKSKNLAMRDVSLASVVKGAIDETELLGIEHPLETQLDDIMVVGDQMALARAAINLLSNAYRHTPPGTIVSIRTWSDFAFGHLRIADRGAGIPAHLRESMWERYVRGEHPDSSGIGLGLVREIVLAHNGTIKLEDVDGTSFLLTFPLARPVDLD